jgi:transposase
MNQVYLGIDISKKDFHVALLKGPQQKAAYKRFTNAARGFGELLVWLNAKDVSDMHACMEATGSYGEELATFLFEHGFSVSVVNPAQIKGFSRSELARTKTDKADAQMIARFCLAMHPPLWHPKPLPIRQLEALQKRLNDVKAMILREENRLESVTPAVQALIEESIAFHREQVATLEKKIQEHIDSDPDLRSKKDLLISIAGVGVNTATVALCLLGEPGKFTTARQVTAFIGLNPKDHQSGTSVHGRGHISKTGDSRLRQAFYMPALTAMRFNPILRDFAERLKRKGKSGKVIVVAVMKKLVHIIFGVLKSQKPFDPQWAKNN